MTWLKISAKLKGQQNCDLSNLEVEKNLTIWVQPYVLLSEFLPMRAMCKEIFIESPTLIGHKIIPSSSFKSPKTYPFTLHIIKSVAALLTHAVLAQSNPIYVSHSRISFLKLLYSRAVSLITGVTCSLFQKIPLREESRIMHSKLGPRF